MINLQNIAKTGTGLYLVLQKFTTHPDYIEIVGLDTPKLSLDPFYADLLYTYIVKLKVLS